MIDEIRDLQRRVKVLEDEAAEVKRVRELRLGSYRPKPPVEHKCLRCSRPFMATRRAKYCSDSCRVTAFKHRKQANA